MLRNIDDAASNGSETTGDKRDMKIISRRVCLRSFLQLFLEPAKLKLDSMVLGKKLLNIFLSFSSARL